MEYVLKLCKQCNLVRGLPTWSPVRTFTSRTQPLNTSSTQAGKQKLATQTVDHEVRPSRELTFPVVRAEEDLPVRFRPTEDFVALRAEVVKCMQRDPYKHEDYNKIVAKSRGEEVLPVVFTDDPPIIIYKYVILNPDGSVHNDIMQVFNPSYFNIVSPETTSMIAQRIDLWPSTLKLWWGRRKEQLKVTDQNFSAVRHEVLGPELAAAHFLVYRDAAVKFQGHTEWVKKDEQGKYNLPESFTEGLKLEAIDASYTDLLYEGLDNMVNLGSLRYLNLKECPYVNDWFLDRMSSQFRDTLEVLDISGCKNVSERGITSLHRMRNLRVLKMENMCGAHQMEVVSCMLEDSNPALLIQGVGHMDVDILPPGEESKLLQQPAS